MWQQEFDPEEPEPSEVQLIIWLLTSYEMKELSADAGLSERTLYRMFDGFATERTLAKLKPIIDQLMKDEAESAIMFPLGG